MEQNWLIQLLGPALLFVMMLGMGMNMVWDDILRVVREPKAVAVGTVNQMLVLPLVGWALVLWFELPGELAVGLLILTFCPGGVGSNLFSLLAKGDAALSVTLTFVSSCLIVLTLPLLVNVSLQAFTGDSLSQPLPVADTILRVCLISLLPIAIGMWLRRRFPVWAARTQNGVKLGGFVLVGLMIAGIVAKEWHTLLDYAQQAGAITLALCLITMLLGFASGRLFRLDRPQSIAIAIEVGMQNSALAIVIAGLLGRTQMAVPAVIYTVIVSVVCLGIVLWAHWNGRRQDAPGLRLQTGVKHS